MYATCLFCNDALGRNQAIEHFPVGRRLAFDAAKGRLWVVCPRCARWNLSPLETRWEAIEEAERAFRATPLRASTDQMGLARLREGTELVRVGNPLLPEFAAWRYGGVFGQRHRKATIIGLSSLAVTGGVAALQFAPAFGASRMAWVATYGGALTVASQLLTTGRLLYRSYIPRLMVVGHKGEQYRVTAFDASSAQVLPNDSGTWGMVLKHGAGATRLDGVVARAAMAKLLPTVNREGSGRRTVAAAVTLVSEYDFTSRIPAALHAPERWSPHESPSRIGRLPGPLRLAFEMALHETDERRALEGELHELEARWKEADAIASIADSL